MKISLLSVLLVFTLPFFASGQSFFTADPFNAIRKVMITSNGPVSEYMTSCIPRASSIAVANGVMYTLTINSEIYMANITANGLTNCSKLAGPFNFGPYLPNAMTADKNGNLYLALGNQLYIYDVKRGILGSPVTIPAYSAGDLLFYNNELYLAAVSGIYKIDLKNPSASSLVIQSNSMSMYGLVSFNDNGKIRVFGLEVDQNTKMIELDLDAGISLGVAYNLSHVVFDGASETEAGSLPDPIMIGQVIIKQDCDNLFKGYVEISTAAHTDVYTYTLNTGESNTTGIFSNLNSGTYTVKVTTTTGVPAVEQSFDIPDYSLTKPVSTYVIQQPVCQLPGNVTFSVTGTTGPYRISRNGQLFSPAGTIELEAGNYHFEVLDANNCLADTLNIKLSALPCNPVIFPNTFSPNADGMNDIFRPSQASQATQYQLSIFNRQGSLIFISKNMRTGWDGQNQGKPMPVGTYYWMSTYTDENGKRASQHGYITLLR